MRRQEIGRRHLKRRDHLRGFKKTDDGFFLPVAFTNGLFFSLSIERINEDIGYLNSNWKMFPLCFNGGVQFSSVSALLAKGFQPRTRQDIADLLEDIFTSDKSSLKYATSTGGKLRALLRDAVQHTKKRQETNAEMQDADYNFKELVHECCKQGFRCDNVGAFLSLLGGFNATERMISIDRKNSVTDNYTALLTHLLCACFSTLARKAVLTAMCSERHSPR
jgi:hypothetical protein